VIAEMTLEKGRSTKRRFSFNEAAIT